LYRSVFYQLLGRCREAAGSHGFRFKNKLLTLDATLIELCASVFDWAQYRRTKGAVKLHLLLDHQGLLPSFALITQGCVHESRVARSLRFEPGTIVVFDRGYADYDWFASLDADGVFFVTRMKDNADYGVVECRPVPEHGAVRRDQIIFLYKAARRGNYDLFLRRIEVWDEEQQRGVVFLTNHRGFAASTIAAIYRQRWQIELFFKALKQNLRIRTFVGTSCNCGPASAGAYRILLRCCASSCSSIATCSSGSISLSNLPLCSTQPPSNWRFPGEPNLDSTYANLNP
jgi:hypothetical protein